MDIILSIQLLFPNSALNSLAFHTYIHLITLRGFIHIFSRMATGFHSAGRQNLLNCTMLGKFENGVFTLKHMIFMDVIGLTVK